MIFFMSKEKNLGKIKCTPCFHSSCFNSSCYMSLVLMRDYEKIQNRITLCNTFCVCQVGPFLSLAPAGHSRSGRMSVHSVFRLKLCI